MTKRKSAKASKKARSPKIAAQAHRAAQAIVRSPKSRPRLVAAGSGDKRQNDSKPAAPIVKPVAPVAIENPVTVLQEDIKQTMTENNLSERFAFSSATADLRAYQALLLEMAQANMAIALEFSQRLATTRSPFGFFNVIAEFTGRRIAMTGKYSKEMAELSPTRRA